jgi:hypothetical protein
VNEDIDPASPDRGLTAFLRLTDADTDPFERRLLRAGRADALEPARRNAIAQELGVSARPWAGE